MFGWLRRLFGTVDLASEPDSAVLKEFYSSVAGVSHRNRDRTSRQKIIRESVYAGMFLTLQFEDDNPVDKNAVALLTPNGEQIGYLNGRLASEVRDWIAEGELVSIVVKEITGGESDKPTHGVNILVRVRSP